MSGFTHQGLYLILQFLLIHIHMLTPVPMRMHTLCSLEAVQRAVMRYQSMALRLHQLHLAHLTSRTQLWPL